MPYLLFDSKAITVTMKNKILKQVGIGLRAPHIATLLREQHGLTWVEIHSENWFAEAGPIAEKLTEIRSHFDLSLHGVGLSLGSADPLDMTHLRRVKRLMDRCDPVLISEHLSWGAVGGQHSNDLLPLPYNASSLALLRERIDTVQQVLGRELLIENLSSYCTFQESTMPEWAFIRELVEKANCGLLLDINNVHVNARNHPFDVDVFLQHVDWTRVKEIHLAGYEEFEHFLVDTHARPVQEDVWRSFAKYQHQLKDNTRVLIEWDSDLPTIEVLLGEAMKASELIRHYRGGDQVVLSNARPNAVNKLENSDA